MTKFCFENSMTNLAFESCASQDIMPTLITKHYLHRRCPCSFAFKATRSGLIVAALSFGVPPSRHLQKSASPNDPNLCIELNRLWVSNCEKKNFASAFVAWALKQLPPRIVVSYADTSAGHVGYVYRALNFYYAGWTDMERKTPRWDYVVPGKHSREAFRCGKYTRVRRKPKIKYWITTGNRRERKHLEKICGWPKYDWRKLVPPSE